MRASKPLAVAILVVVATDLSGCAAVFKGTSDKVSFDSDPTGADVYVNGQLTGKTPFEQKLQSNRSYNVEIKKEGFEPKTVVVNHEVGAGWIVLDILFLLFFVPLIVDAATGAWFGLEPDHVKATLVPKPGTPATPSKPSADTLVTSDPQPAT